jgi:uncharacterized membrane protein YkvA (DUF1232 family)
MESEPLTASLTERLDEKDIALMEAAVSETSPVKAGTSKRRIADRVAERLGRRYVSKLATREGRKNAIEEVPERMHTVAKQSKLAVEFVDDVVSGEYRDGRWRSAFLLAGVVLYSLSPADVVPDWLPLFGSIDDLLVIGLATRAAQSQLKKYARAKGYPVEQYFA